jgi:hypothetical protein
VLHLCMLAVAEVMLISLAGFGLSLVRSRRVGLPVCHAQNTSDKRTDVLTVQQHARQDDHSGLNLSST